MFPRFRNLLVRQQALYETLEVPERTEFLRLVRWRKRRWAPIPASKKLYVRKPTPENQEEKEELTWRNRHYNTLMKSLRKYMIDDLKRTEARSKGGIAFLKARREDYERMTTINDAWNEETKKIREARLAEEEAAREKEYLQYLEEQEERQRQRMEEAREQVLQQQAEVSSFVDVTNLEEEIEKSLNIRANYNFAIDKEGNRYIELPDGSTEVQQQMSGEENEEKQQQAQT